MRKKGETEKLVLKAIKKEFKSRSEIRDKTRLPYTTVKDVIVRLLRDKKVSDFIREEQ